MMDGFIHYIHFAAGCCKKRIMRVCFGLQRSRRSHVDCSTKTISSVPKPLIKNETVSKLFFFWRPLVFLNFEYFLFFCYHLFIYIQHVIHSFILPSNFKPPSVTKIQITIITMPQRFLTTIIGSFPPRNCILLTFQSCQKVKKVNDSNTSFQNKKNIIIINKKRILRF